MRAPTPGPRNLPRHDGASEDDDAVWRALRARAEHSARAAQVTPLRSESPVAEPDWEELRARAEARHRLELRLAGPAVKTPPAQPRREVPAHRPGLGTPLLQLPMALHQVPDPPSDSFALPMTALAELEDGAFPLPSRPKRVIPVLLAACVLVGAFGTALTRHFLAEAEQQAHIEAVIRDIQIASAQRPASAVAEPVAVRPQAEAPSSETLRAFMEMTTPPSAPPSAPIANRAMLRPARPLADRPLPKKARPVATPAQEPSRTTERETTVGEDEPNLSDDPLFGL